MDNIVYLRIRENESLDFLKSVFNAKKGRDIKISRNDKYGIGKYINSMVQYSDFPVKKPDNHNNNVNLIIPKHRNSTAKYHFSFLSAERQKQINDFIEAILRKNLIGYIIVAKVAQIQKKDAIYNFINTMNLTDDGKIFDKYTKYSYRFFKEIENNLLKKV